MTQFLPAGSNSSRLFFGLFLLYLRIPFLPPSPMEEITVIQNKIYEIRGQRVMLDFDLAGLYQVETKALNRAVKRNIERFPKRFMFQLDKLEFENLRFQFGTSSGHGGTRYLPYAFTELCKGLHNSVYVNKKIM